MVLFLLSEMCAASSWWHQRIVDVTCWGPTDVALDGHDLMQFFDFIKDVFPSNVFTGQFLVLFLIVEVSHLLNFFSDFCQELERWTGVLMVSFSSCLNE